jgi:outer membrane protein
MSKTTAAPRFQRMRPQLRIACTMAFLAASGISISVRAADLLSIYHQAQTADVVFASARATYAAAREKAPQGLAGLLPVISASANTQINDRNLTNRNPLTPIPVGPERYNTNSATVTATQPLFNYQNWISYKQGKVLASQADAQLTQAGQDLILRVAQAYFEVLVAESNIALATAQKAAIGEQLAQAKRNFEVGTATITDANDAQARYDLSVSQEVAAQNDLEIKKQTLQQILGKPAPELAKFSATFPLAPPTPNDMEHWVDQAMDTSPAIQIAQANLVNADEDVSRNRGGHLPTLSAVASYNDTGSGAGLQGGAGYDSITKYLGLQLNVPIYQGGLINSQVRQAIANLDKAKQDLENARRTTTFNTRQAFLGVTSGVAQVKALQAALVSTQTSLDSSVLGQQVGVRTQVDVLNAQQQLFNARREYAQAVYNYAMSALKLKSAVGTLSQDDVAYVNTWLQ